MAALKENGVMMIDHVHYALPFGIIGRIANAVYVQQKVQSIFDYREKKIQEIFPSRQS